MKKIKSHFFSIGFLLITVGIAFYAMYLGDDILPDGTVVETGRMLMLLLLIRLICLKSMIAIYQTE